MFESYKPKVVVTIHGIRTRGRWQKEVTPYLAKHGLVPYHIDYGWFAAALFFFPWSRNSKVQRVRREIRDLIDRTGARRLNVIAHSFGTYIAWQILTSEGGAICFDRVVLAGCIIPRDCDWKDLISRKCLVAVRNEAASGDRVVALASVVSKRLRWISRLRAGDSGRKGFEQKLPQLLEFRLEGHHSEVLNALKFESWARFIAFPLLPDDVAKKVRGELQWLRQEAASLLGEPQENVRVNLFAPMDGYLKIVPGATDNMKYAPEYNLCIEPGHGATGTAFARGSPCVVVKRGETWPGGHLPGDELDKIHPALKWAISLPVTSETRLTVVGVVNVDGLDNVPPFLQDTLGKECQAVLLALHGVVLERFGPYLEAAFRGDHLPEAGA